MNTVTEPVVKIRYKADQIKTNSGPLALTDDQIADIPLEKVYEWIKTGQWKQRDFFKWLKALRVTE